MKKFISMVMAAAMVVSLVPATAFAASGEVKATAKIVDAWEKDKDFNGLVIGSDVPEVQLKITDADYQKTDDNKDPEIDVTYTLENANFYKDANENEYTKTEIEKFFEVQRKGNDILGEWGQIDATYKYEKETTKSVVAQGIFDGDEYYADDKGKTPVVAVPDYTTATIKTAAVTEADALENLIGAANVANVIKNANNGAARYEAKATFTADGTNADIYNAGDVVVYVEDLATSAAVYYTEAEVVTNIESKLSGTEWYKKVVDTPAVDGVKGGVVYIKELEIVDDNEVKVTFAGKFEEDDIISFDLKSLMNKTSVGRTATVSVESDMVDADDLVYVSILDQGITATVKKLASVAEEERVNLERNLEIKSNVGDFANTQKFEMKLSKGFEFYTVNGVKVNDNEYEFEVGDFTLDGDKITIDKDDIVIEAVSAKAGATAVLTVKALKDGAGTFAATTTVEVAKVVDYKVELSVDEDEDVPVIYSGVDVDNTGITDDSDHLSLEVTAKETFPGAWSMRKGFNFELPEGVYVTDVDVISTENFVQDAAEANNADWRDAFWNAYQDGKHVNFEFAKRVFNDVDVTLEEDPAEVVFQLELVADPTFSGDVTLKFTGDLVDEQEVVIAKFVKPYEVKAEQNDLIIDYRNTEIPTAITVTEAEAGLWEKGATFTFTVDKGKLVQFEDDATFEVDKDSELEIDDFTVEDEGQIGFEVDDESDEAATVTIKDMKLFMQRNIPAGAYALKLNTSMEEAFLAQTLFAPDCDNANCDGDCNDKNNDCIVDDVDDYSTTVKEGFVNVVTAGRDQDDASFTTKVVVPVGEKYIVAGEKQIELDVPAYVSAAGYTMLPVRAVATALGINNDNVLWNQETRTVTILYGQRIITMSAGEKVVYVNGSAIPAAAKVEITNDRTFLPMRDLATALGVTDITWDAATKTATLNGGQK